MVGKQNSKRIWMTSSEVARKYLITGSSSKVIGSSYLWLLFVKNVVFEFVLQAHLDFEMCREDIVREQENDSKRCFPWVKCRCLWKESYGFHSPRPPSCSPILLIFLSLDLFREKAEQTIWNRLRQLKALKTKRPRSLVPLRIGILGIHSFSDFSILIWVPRVFL